MHHSEKELKQFGENVKFYKCCKKDEPWFSLLPTPSGCASKMHEFEVTPGLESIMKRKHFCVEAFLREGEKDPIIEAMN